MVNSKTMFSSPGCRMSGMPHSKRSGPMGENHRKPKPKEVRSMDRSCGSPPNRSDLKVKVWSSLKALPASKKMTPLMPTFSKMGNSISA